MRHTTFSVIILIVMGTTAAYAQSPAETPPSPAPNGAAPTQPRPDQSEKKPEQINTYFGMGLKLATTYVFRGWNMFHEEKHSDQNMLASPTLTWYIPDAKLSIGYTGIFQIAGNNISDNVDAARNIGYHFFLQSTYRISEKLRASGRFMALLYPHADKELVGTTAPTWLEPSANFYYLAKDAVFGFETAYLWGAQSAEYVRDLSYLYLRPHVSKRIRVGFFNVQGALSYGFKLFKGGNEDRANVHDFLASASIIFRLKSWRLTLGASVSFTTMGNDAQGNAIDSSEGWLVWGWLEGRRVKRVAMEGSGE